MDSRKGEARVLWATVLAVLLLIILSVFGSLSLRPADHRGPRLALGAAAPASLVPGLPETTLSRVAALVRPAVVYIEAKGDDVDDPPQRSGSGLVVHEDGYLVTNAHVVEGARWVKAFFEDGKELSGYVFGRNKRTDIAVIKVESDEPLPVAALGDSDQLQVGEFVLAHGAPFGFRATVSVGIISGLNKSGLGLAAYEHFIVTDAAINRGNSGGPLVNLRGEVIGINTAILTSGQHGEGYSGVGLAIPINVVKEVAGELIGSGQARPTGGAGRGSKLETGLARLAPDRQVPEASRQELPAKLLRKAGKAVAELVAEGADGASGEKGSAFVIDADGFLMTNAHVIEGAGQQVEVYLKGRGKLIGEVIGRDTHTDIAVIKVNSHSPLQTIPLGNSDHLRVGDFVAAIGGPMWQEDTSFGSVTGLNRDGLGIATYESFIVTDARIHAGLSGGPLLNRRGEVVGVNTARSGSGGGEQSQIGYAIPINIAKEVAEQLIDGRLLRRLYAGFSGSPVTAELASTIGLGETYGYIVLYIADDGPAKRDGLMERDVILAVDGERLRNAEEWRNKIVPALPLGTVLHLAVYRDGERVTVSLKLDKYLPRQQADKSGKTHHGLPVPRSRPCPAP
ncbi:MAG: S1C family serine protease [Acidobacteriota bacterium]